MMITVIVVKPHIEARLKRRPPIIRAAPSRVKRGSSIQGHHHDNRRRRHGPEHRRGLTPDMRRDNRSLL
ncbi:MAG: hypothetical protein ACJA1R_000798 [Flavobacteriales bacterium]|jgi:hypothetical protein